MPERNDPCPCGSGKKYKKCCGMLDAARKKIAHTFSKKTPGANPVVDFAQKVMSIVESQEEFVPPANVPESHASTEESANPALSPPERKFTRGTPWKQNSTGTPQHSGT